MKRRGNFQVESMHLIKKGYNFEKYLIFIRREKKNYRNIE